MTTWLLDAGLKSESRKFECDPELDVTKHDSVFLRESNDDAIVGEFNVLATRTPSEGGTEELKKLHLASKTDELFRATDTRGIDDATERQLDEGELRFLRQAMSTENDMCSPLSPDSFFGADGEAAGSETTAAPESPATGDASPDLTLQEVFTRQLTAEGADFSEQNVAGEKELRDASLRGAVLSDTNLNGVTFRNVNLRDVDLRGARLHDATFTGKQTQLGGADFTNARLRGATFEVNVSNCVFTGARMVDVDLSEAQLAGADFSGARLKRATLNRSEPERANFDDAVMQNVKTASTHFEKASFVGADLSGTTFTDTGFEDTDFADADLGNVTFKRCELENVQFDGATMTELTLEDHETANLDFERADLTDANLGGSNFESARFTGARMSSADCEGCELTGTTIDNARADGAVFDGASLEYASLSGTDLTGASFEGAKLHACQLVSARVGTDTDFEGIHDYRKKPDSTAANGEGRSGRKVASVYQTLEAVYRNNSLTEESLRYLRRRKNATIQAKCQESGLGSTIPDLLLKYTTGHGTKPGVLLGWSFVAVFLTSVVHASLGSIRHTTLGRLAVVGGDASAIVSLAGSFLFSLLTFTGLGYGRFSPVGSVGELLAVVQAGLGVVFFGLLIFILSTRASR